MSAPKIVILSLSKDPEQRPIGRMTRGSATLAFSMVF